MSSRRGGRKKNQCHPDLIDPSQPKVCSKCHELRHVNDFYRQTDGRLRSECKFCSRLRAIEDGRARTDRRRAERGLPPIRRQRRAAPAIPSTDLGRIYRAFVGDPRSDAEVFQMALRYGGSPAPFTGLLPPRVREG